jgi:hypothetical protein
MGGLMPTLPFYALRPVQPAERCAAPSGARMCARHAGGVPPA